MLASTIEQFVRRIENMVTLPARSLCFQDTSQVKRPARDGQHDISLWRITSSTSSVVCQ